MANPEPTVLEAIEQARMEHVALAVEAALQEVGFTGIDRDTLNKAAHAAVCAADRYPADRSQYPFNRDLQTAPAGMHPSVREAFQEIDAGVYSGDAFDATDDHLYLAAYVQRWSQELRRRREDDWRNQPTDGDDDQD